MNVHLNILYSPESSIRNSLSGFIVSTRARNHHSWGFDQKRFKKKEKTKQKKKNGGPFSLKTSKGYKRETRKRVKKIFSKQMGESGDRRQRKKNGPIFLFFSSPPKKDGAKIFCLFFNYYYVDFLNQEEEEEANRSRRHLDKREG